jgi:choline dehydrogenase
VGENLQDHWQIRVQHRVHDTPTLNAVAGSFVGRARMAALWAVARKGPMAAQPPLLTAFARVTDGAPAPDVQVHVSAASYDRVGGPLHPWPGITSSACILRPAARGHVHITTADPSAQPEILSNLLGHPDDQEIAVRAVALVRRIMAQPAMARFRPEETSPGPETADRDALIEYARRVVSTVFHPVGTCRMGQDAGAVVDPDLRLTGLSGLRIADASVMPLIPSGNTAAPTVMIAERAAELIASARRAKAA